MKREYLAMGRNGPELAAAHMVMRRSLHAGAAGHRLGNCHQRNYLVIALMLARLSGGAVPFAPSLQCSPLELH